MTNGKKGLATGLVALTAVIVLCGTVRAADFVIASREKPAEHAVVIAPDASETLRYAADEFRRCVKRLTGVQLALKHAGAGVRLVQNLALEDRFRIRVADGELTVTGGEKGVIYGVYEILERFGGIVWPAPGQEVAPKLDHLAVPDGFDFSDGPAIEVRDTSWSCIAYHPEHATRLRVNGPYSVAKGKYGRIPYRFDWKLKKCHSIDWLLPPDEFFGSHPEYFCEINGKRTKSFANPCWTNPDAMRIIRERAVAQIRKVRRADPQYRCFGISQNDGSEGMCRCRNCEAAYAKYDSPAGVILELVNSIADEVADEFPDVWVQTLSYLFTRRPPKGIRPRDNVMICFCTADCEFSKALDESRFPENRAFAADMKVWNGLAKRIQVWDYTMYDAAPLSLYPNLRTLQKNLRFFAASNVRDLFEQGVEYVSCDSDLRGWLIAKWMWNPELGYDTLVKTFTDAYYGAAAPYAREIIRMQDGIVRDERTNPLKMYSNFNDPCVPDAYYEKVSDLLGKAAAAVMDDSRCLSNVLVQAMCNDASLLLRYTTSGACGSVYASRHPENFDVNRFRRMQAVARSLLGTWDGSDRWHGKLHHRYRKAAQVVLQSEIPTQAADAADIEETLFKNLPAFWGGRVDDPEAGNGRAMRLNPEATMWGVLKFDIGGIVVDPGVRYRLKIRAKVEREPGRAGTAFRACVFDYGRKTRTMGDLAVTCDAVGDGYRWYDLGEWTPSPDETFHLWAAPWKGEAPYKAIWVDKLRIERVK